MIEPDPSTTAQKLVVGQRASGFKKKKNRKKRIQMYLGFNMNYCCFLHKTKNVSLTLCQSSELLQDTLLTKLLGHFIALHNTQFNQRLENLT